MRAKIRFELLLAAALLATVALQHRAIASDQPTLTREQIKQFLLTAKVVKSENSKKGVTHPSRLTLSDGTVTHLASFQGTDERKSMMQLASGTTEIGFVDSYKYNIAAYNLAELLGIEDMLPVYVVRKYNGSPGSLSWWMPVKMDEEERLKQKISAPNTDAWNNQMYRVRVFDELIYDTDANLTNVLIGEDWKIWRIDFTRAFRLSKDLRNPKNLIRCDRQLFGKLKALNGDELAQRTKGFLTKDEVKALMARRDKIVAYFENMISKSGEANVLY